MYRNFPTWNTVSFFVSGLLDFKSLFLELDIIILCDFLTFPSVCYNAVFR